MYCLHTTVNDYPLHVDGIFFFSGFFWLFFLFFFGGGGGGGGAKEGKGLAGPTLRPRYSVREDLPGRRRDLPLMKEMTIRRQKTCSKPAHTFGGQRMGVCMAR